MNRLRALAVAAAGLLVALVAWGTEPVPAGPRLPAGVAPTISLVAPAAMSCGNPSAVKRRCGVYVYTSCMDARKDEILCGLQRQACNRCTAGWLACTAKARNKQTCEPCHEVYWQCMTDIGAPPAKDE